MLALQKRNMVFGYRTEQDTYKEIAGLGYTSMTDYYLQVCEN